VRDVVLGRAALLGSRLTASERRGLFSPVEARVHLGLDYDNLEAEERSLLRTASRMQRTKMILRAVIARMVAGSRTRAAVAEIFGIRPAEWTVGEALEFIFHESAPDARLVFFAHPHALNISLVDDELSELLREADAVLADGIGLQLATRMLKGRLPSNLNGTDLFPLICQRAAESGRPLVFVGAREEVVQECARRTRDQYPGLRIPLVRTGYLNEIESRAVADEIRNLERPIVLVGMGSPVQEKWAKKYLGDCNGATVITVGGLFDFFSGRIPRAPKAWRELGLEWLYRLLQEPRRMARRYLLGNPLFLLMVALQRLRLRPRRLASWLRVDLLLGVRRKRHLLGSESREVQQPKGAV
jgi:N-acetylglucosaminyldiphosphoundecaprenol N-acetyl-beta-D-mannosaminyltransferase